MKFKFAIVYFVAACLIANIVDLRPPKKKLAPDIAGTDTMAASRAVINSNFHIVATHTRDITILNPLQSMTGQTMFEEGQALTITRVACNQVGGTNVVINLFARTEASPESGGTQILTADLTCTAGGFVTTTSFSAVNLTSRTPIALTITSISGTPTVLRVFVEYTL